MFIKIFSYNFSRPVPVRTTDAREIRFQTSAYDFIVCCTNPTSDFLFFGHRQNNNIYHIVIIKIKKITNLHYFTNIQSFLEPCLSVFLQLSRIDVININICYIII